MTLTRADVMAAIEGKSRERPLRSTWWPERAIMRARELPAGSEVWELAGSRSTSTSERHETTSRGTGVGAGLAGPCSAANDGGRPRRGRATTRQGLVSGESRMEVAIIVADNISARDGDEEFNQGRKEIAAAAKSLSNRFGRRVRGVVDRASFAKLQRARPRVEEKIRDRHRGHAGDARLACRDASYGREDARRQFD